MNDGCGIDGTNARVLCGRKIFTGLSTDVPNVPPGLSAFSCGVSEREEFQCLTKLRGDRPWRGQAKVGRSLPLPTPNQELLKVPTYPNFEATFLRL